MSDDRSDLHAGAVLAARLLDALERSAEIPMALDNFTDAFGDLYGAMRGEGFDRDETASAIAGTLGTCIATAVTLDPRP